MTEIENYRSAFNDALRRPIPLEGELRIWLDDDVVDRRAPEGWVHLRTVREVCLMLLAGRLVELSLDNDLEGDIVFGQGGEVIDFLEEVQAVHGRPLWPRDGVNIHTANDNARGRMKRAIENLPESLGVEVELTNPRQNQPHYLVTVPEVDEH